MPAFGRVGIAGGLSVVAPVLLQGGIEGDLLGGDGQEVMLGRDVLVLEVRGRHLFADRLDEDMPALEVEPARTLHDELLELLRTYGLSEGFLAEARKLRLRSVGGCALDLGVGVVEGTPTHLVDGLVSRLGGAVQLVLGLGLDEQHLGIAQDGGAGVLPRDVGGGILGHLYRVDVFAEADAVEVEPVAGEGVVEALGDGGVAALIVGVEEVVERVVERGDDGLLIVRETGGEHTATDDVAVDAELMLHGEDQFGVAQLLIHRPVVAIAIQQLVFPLHLRGVGYGLAEELPLVSLGILRIALRPDQVHLSQQGRCGTC